MNEDDVIKGVKNYLEFKNSHRDDFIVEKIASAEKREKGVDLYGYCKSDKNKSNRYYIEAKGTLKASDNSKKKSSFNTEFRWAVSQIVLRDLRDRIRHTLLADRLGMLSDKEMTATEILARNADMVRILGATYGRLLHEFIRPLCERGLQILSRRGLIEKISLHSDAELKYIAPIAQMAREEMAI